MMISSNRLPSATHLFTIVIILSIFAIGMYLLESNGQSEISQHPKYVNIAVNRASKGKVNSDMLQPKHTTVSNTSKRRSYYKDKRDNFLVEVSEPEDVVSQVNGYAMYAASMPVSVNGYTYIFYLPMTVRAWKRIGYGSVVVLVGTKLQWRSIPVLAFVVDSLLQTDAIVIFIKPLEGTDVSISQAARIFAFNFVNWTDNGTFLLTADSDIWPFTAEPYHRHNKSIVITNPFQFDNFSRHGKTMPQYSMQCIGMNVTMWHEVIDRPGHSPQNAPEISSYLALEFKDTAYKNIRKGYGSWLQGWFMDQYIISQRIFEWAEKHGRSNIYNFKRNAYTDMIDKICWNTKKWPLTMTGKYDAHLLLRPYDNATWPRLLPLIKLMYTDKKVVQEMIDYRQQFVKLLDK